MSKAYFCFRFSQDGNVRCVLMLRYVLSKTLIFIHIVVIFIEPWICVQVFTPRSTKSAHSRALLMSEIVMKLTVSLHRWQVSCIQESLHCYIIRLELWWYLTSICLLRNDTYSLIIDFCWLFYKVALFCRTLKNIFSALLDYQVSLVMIVDKHMSAP